MRVETVSVSVRLGEAPVLEDVSLAVASGGWLGVIGPNGAGKSTLLRALVGLVAFEGEVRLDDRPASGERRRRLARLIAFVPQRPTLPPTMSVVDYVLLGRTPHIGVLSNESRRDRAIVTAVLDRLALADLADRAVGQLSGGEAQRVVLARALAQQPAVLVLDEPTTGLDLGHQQQVLELVDELRLEHGLTVISAMHDLTLAAQFAEALLLLVRGAVVSYGRPGDVLTAGEIARHFDATVQVLSDPASGVSVAPVRARTGQIPLDQIHAGSPAGDPTEVAS